MKNFLYFVPVQNKINNNNNENNKKKKRLGNKINQFVKNKLYYVVFVHAT